jgi:Zn-dependent protease
MAYFLFVLITVYVSCYRADSGNTDMVGIAALSVILLTAGAILHEFGHLYMARRLGGRYDEIVLWPFGGVGPASPWSTPKWGFLETVAGPLVNLAVCLACAPLLWLAGCFDWKLLHPLLPGSIGDESIAINAVKLALWINWLLFLVNLIPAYPFDGGRLVYYLLGVLWPDLPHRQRRRIVGHTARIFAGGLLVLAWFACDDVSREPLPVWVGLALLAVFVFFAAKRCDEDGSETSSETNRSRRSESADVGGLEQADPLHENGAIAEPLARWMEERHQSARSREEIEAEEEKHLDEILARLHITGMEGLTPEERELLERVSARYRSRQGSR